MNDRKLVLLRGALAAAALGAACAPAASHAQARPAPALDVARIEALADSLARDHVAAGFMPGVTVAVARNGEIVFARGYGQADVEMGVPAGTGTVYGIRSVTKQFTAAAVMRLVEAGTIALDDPITKYLPEYPVQGRTVTVRHLLNHTSGIRDYTARSETRPNWFRLDVSYPEMVEMWGGQPVASEPGETYDYNSLGYYLLGEIVARVTGTPFAEYVGPHLLEPLGLTETLFCDARRVVPGRAEGYDHEGGRLVNAHYVSMHVFRAGGSFCSTVADLVRWTHLLHAGRVVSPASLLQMTTPAVLASGDTVGYGFGFYLEELGGHRKVSHGGTFGFGAYLSHYPDDGLTIAVLTNSTRGRAKAEEIEKALARAALGVHLLDLPLGAEEIARYEGTYAYQGGRRTRDLRVFGADGRMMAELAGGNAFRLLYQGGGVFVPAIDDDDRLVFSLVDGRAAGFTHHEGRWDATPARRKP